jgi:hypothetical protein
LAELILYATKKDGDAIRTWINTDADVAWIVKVDEIANTYRWRAVQALDVLEEQEYALWHLKSGPLNIPSGDPQVADAYVIDPFRGWTQKLDHAGATAPWFGANLPGPYTFRFAEAGREVPGSLARSGFFWLGDRFKSIGNPAHAEAKRWWRRLRRFLGKSAVRVPWPDQLGVSKRLAYVFPDALVQTTQGRARDVNP